MIYLVICLDEGWVCGSSFDDICQLDEEIEYQELFFDMFTTYLANNTNDMYMMMDHETEEVEYVSPNVERVLGVKPEKLIDYLHSADFTSVPVAAYSGGWYRFYLGRSSGHHRDVCFFFESAGSPASPRFCRYYCRLLFLQSKQ